MKMNKNKMDRQTLVDWFISSVDDEVKPIWTEEHIDELLKDFDIYSKEEDKTIETKENKISKVILYFENCEACELTPNMFKYLQLEGIKTDIDVNCYQFENGEMHRDKSCEKFEICINELGLKLMMNLSEITLEERLKRTNDITSVILVYEDGKEEDIYVPWTDDQYSNENDYQSVYDIQDGMIELKIEEKK